MTDKLIDNSLQLIKDSLWNTTTDPQTSSLCSGEEIYLFFLQHAIAAIPGNLIQNLQLPEAVKAEWTKHVFQQVYTYKTYEYNQELVLKKLNQNAIPVVVIKGTAASQYYPIPEFRAVGDIDLLVRPDDFFRAKDVLISCGFDELYPNTPVDRHLNLVKGQVHIELHRRFASEYVIDDPRAFDEMLFSDITLEHYKLRESSNGLVLLEHIAQHLNAGIGLRQIIDWMLFVSSYLDDDAWESEFKSLVEKTGLKELAISLTHMCQAYLGLPENSINWCNDADESLCHELMEYILCCGNFGHSRNTFDSGVITQIPSIEHPIRLFRYVQKHGKDNWVACQKYPALKPFAWIYQSLKYINMSREENADGRTIREMYEEAKKRRNMLMKLGIHANKI